MEERESSARAQLILRQAAKASVEDLMGLFPDRVKSSVLRTAITRVPNKDRHWVLKAVLGFRHITSSHELANIMGVLPDVPTAERSRFCEIAHSFEGTSPSVILPLLGRIQSEERASFIHDLRGSDPTGQWLLTALPLERMQFSRRENRLRMFERVKITTRPFLVNGRIKEENSLTLDEVNKLHDMSDEEFEGFQDLFGRVLGNSNTILHRLLQLPSADFQDARDFMGRFIESYQPRRPMSFFFPLLNVSPSERETCLELWQRIRNLSDIPTNPDDFHVQLMGWTVAQGDRFISSYQSFLTRTMNMHDRRILLDQFLHPDQHCRSERLTHLSPAGFIDKIRSTLEQDIRQGLEEQHRFSRLVDLIENPEASLRGFFAAQRAREQLLREQRDLEERMRLQRERERQAQEALQRAQQVREERLREQQARDALQREQREREQLELQRRELDRRAQNIPAYADWVFGQEAMMRERQAVTNALLTVWGTSELARYKPQPHEVDAVFKDFCTSLTRVIASKMSRIIKEHISDGNKDVCSRLVNAAVQCPELISEKEFGFVYDTRFPALPQFFKFLRGLRSISRGDEEWALNLLRQSDKKDRARLEERVQNGEPVSSFPPFIPFSEEVSAKLTPKIIPCLREMQRIVRNAEYFRLETAVRGLGQVSGIRGDYTYDHRLPGLRTLCGFLGNLCNAALTPTNYAIGWMNENNKNPRLTKVFPELEGSETLGEALGLNPNLQGQMVSLLTAALHDRETIRPHSLSLISHFTRKYFEASFDSFNSVVDALFMARRGHADPGQITNISWPDQIACADGVYVGLARTLTEIEATQLLTSTIAGLTVVSCATAGHV